MSLYQPMRDNLQTLYNASDGRWTLRHMQALTDIEYGQTFSCYAKSAQYVYKLLEAEGFSPELLTFPADGKTTYQDKRMPLAWDATLGRLTVLKAPIPFEEPVVADFAAMPFSLVKHSVATPEGGLRVRLVTETQVYAGEDCRGAMVLLEPDTPPRPFSISPLLDLGALGFVTEFLTGGLETPDCVQWVNAATDDSSHWHVQADDRDFIGFSVSPRIGRKLRQAAAFGAVEVLVESDGQRYEGTVDAVTALIPGRRQEEVWMLSHLYEPLLNDNSSGVMVNIHVARQLRDLTASGALPPLEFSVRLVFAMEHYGFAAVAEHFGGSLHSRAIGAVNLDAVPDGDFSLILSPYASPFYGNYLFEMAAQVYEAAFPDAEKFVSWTVGYEDDLFLGDSTTGLPTIWPERYRAKFWHNSCQNSVEWSPELIRRVQSLMALWVYHTASVTQAELPALIRLSAELAQARLNREAAENCENPAERMAFFLEGERRRLRHFARVAEVPEIEEAAQKLTVPALSTGRMDSPWLSYAEGIVARRMTVGLPYDVVRLPKEKRKKLPDDVLYGPMGIILSAMDGKRNLRELICGAMWERHCPVTDKAVKAYIDGVMYLADAGYLAVENKNEIDRTQIVTVLKKLGIEEEDVLLVHSSLSGCGHITGGADALIDAFCETAGEKGAVLMPSFTRPYTSFEGTLNKGRNYRPYSPDNIEAIWVGSVPKAMLRRPGVLRSEHATHSWCGLGQKAAACLSEQRLLDPPASESSPMAKALAAGGKVVFFGCGVSSNSFLHYLEHQAEVDFLENAVVKLQEPDGRQHTEVIHRHLPGCRDFYGAKGLEAKFYQRAMERGLTIRQEKLGAGSVYAMELQQLYDIGMALFCEDKSITLCDEPDCPFCSRFR